jgi:hypothetical protein
MTALLVARGHLARTTSVFDRGVKAAVEEFQARHVDSRGRPLVADGKVGPLTWWALRNPDNSRLLDRPPPQGFIELPPGGSPAGRSALAAATGEINAGACEVGANNAGPWVEKYLNKITPAPENWCAGFVSWCYSQAPGGIPFRYSLGARNIRTQFRDRGWTYDPGERLPQPGDIIVWWRGQPSESKGHIGLVHHAADGVLYTVEGNKGGFPAPVAVFDYVLGRIDRLLGFGAVP